MKNLLHSNGCRRETNVSESCASNCCSSGFTVLPLNKYATILRNCSWICPLLSRLVWACFEVVLSLNLGNDTNYSMGILWFYLGLPDKCRDNTFVLPLLLSFKCFPSVILWSLGADYNPEEHLFTHCQEFLNYLKWYWSASYTDCRFFFQY
jgi:hypothetical protein